MEEESSDIVIITYVYSFQCVIVCNIFTIIIYQINEPSCKYDPASFLWTSNYFNLYCFCFCCV